MLTSHFTKFISTLSKLLHNVCLHHGWSRGCNRMIKQQASFFWETVTWLQILYHWEGTKQVFLSIIPRNIVTVTFVDFIKESTSITVESIFETLTRDVVQKNIHTRDPLLHLNGHCTGSRYPLPSYFHYRDPQIETFPWVLPIFSMVLSHWNPLLS